MVPSSVEAESYPLGKDRHGASMVPCVASTRMARCAAALYNRGLVEVREACLRSVPGAHEAPPR